MRAQVIGQKPPCGPPMSELNGRARKSLSPKEKAGRKHPPGLSYDPV
jgi:hypothetical protein